MAKKLLTFGLVSLLLAGCAANFNNLTPQQVRHNDNNLYPLEVAVKSRQESLRWKTIQPYAVVGTDFYPMRPVPLMTNRWETLVPVPPGTNIVHYRYRFDFKYNAIPARREDSATSPTYTLKIAE